MIFALFFLLSVIVTYAVLKIAYQKSLLAPVTERSSHTIPTPHGGGVAIALTWFIGLIYLFTCKKIDTLLFEALMCGMFLCLVSFLDDLYELSPKLRVAVQALVSVSGLYFLGGVSLLDLGFFVIENRWITNTLAFLGMIWFINLYNFLDGIDGYAGSEALFLSLMGWLFFGGEWFLLLGVSVAGFLVWNWHRAKIFMGDVGSTLLGYNIAVFALYFQNKGDSVLIWFILFGLFFVDATLTLWRRYKNGENILSAHKKHAYQRLVQSGMRHDQVVFYAMGINALLALLAWVAFYFKPFSWGALVISWGLLYGVMRYVDSKKRFEVCNF